MTVVMVAMVAIIDASSPGKRSLNSHNTHPRNPTPIPNETPASQGAKPFSNLTRCLTVEPASRSNKTGGMLHPRRVKKSSNSLQLNLSPLAAMSHDKNAVPVVPVKGRPHGVAIVWIRSIIPIRVIAISVGRVAIAVVTNREPKSDSERHASVRTRRRSKSESTCHQCN